MKFDHNGIGKLADAQSCTVTEKRNGSYELKLICPADGIHAEMLEEGNIILAKPSDTMQPQPFRIYKITTPIDGKLEVQARHISYQLNFITVSPFSVTGCVGAMRGLKSHAASDCPFNVWADVESSATFTLGVPSSFRNCLGGMAGSVLDVFGGEFEWDRYTVKFHKARGADHNVHIIYGKNLTDFKMEKSIENTITGVHPYWVDNETQAVMELPEKVVLQSKRSIPYQKITVLDCTSNFQEKPSEAALREYAQNYIDTTDLTEPEIDIKIDFLQLWNTPGYEDIVEAERVSLCDTVHVFISKLGIEVSSKVTETEYDTLLERYNSITLSNSTVSSRNSSLTGSLNSIRNTATIAYDTAVRAETAVGEQVGGITASIIYDGALFAALFGLHYKNETDSKGNTTRYEERARLHYEKVQRLKLQGFTDWAMQHWTFANDHGKNPQMQLAQRYVAHWPEMREKNVGLLLWGGVGTGKSFMAGCIANALMEQEVAVCMTNFARIMNELNNAFSGRNEVVDRLCGYPLLVIDDFGVERGTEYALEQIYNIIDSRYRSRKPLIVTTNLTLTELKNPQDTAHARIYDRLLELCTPIACTGPSMRKDIGQAKLNLLKTLLA